MSLSLKYPAVCYKCGKWCDPKEEKGSHRSFLHRVPGGWKAHCYPCYKKSKEEKEALKKIEG